MRATEHKVCAVYAQVECVALHGVQKAMTGSMRHTAAVAQSSSLFVDFSISVLGSGWMPHGLGCVV